jgi:hypothetical protein
LIKIKDELKSVVFTMYPDSEATAQDFSGLIMLNRIDGTFVNGFRAKKGLLVSQFVKSKTNSKSNNKTQEDPIPLHEVIIINSYHKVTTFQIFIYSWERPEDVKPEYNYLWDGGSGGGGGPAVEPEPDTEVDVANEIEENIDDTELDDCTKAILDKLKNLTQSDIASIFEKFGTPTNGTYNIKIVLGNPNDMSALAQTETISKNNYLITISEAYIKGTPNNPIRPTDLSIAAVLIHELIHAHFKALFDDFHNNGDTCAYDNYDCLYEKYATKNYVGKIDAQHAQMFDNYVPIIAAILQEFKPGSSSQFYDDIAMSTLFGLQYFDDKYPKGGIERTRIENNRISEDSNTPRGEATPKGTACK